MGKEKIQPESFPASLCTALWVRTSIAEVATAIDILWDHHMMVSKSISQRDHHTTVADPNGWRWWSQPVNNGWLPLGLLVCSHRPPNTPQLTMPAGQIEKRKEENWIQCLCIQILYVLDKYCGFYYKPSCSKQLYYIFVQIYTFTTVSKWRNTRVWSGNAGHAFCELWGSCVMRDSRYGRCRQASNGCQQTGDNCHQGCIHCALSYLDRISGSKTCHHPLKGSHMSPCMMGLHDGTGPKTWKNGLI